MHLASLKKMWREEKCAAGEVAEESGGRGFLGFRWPLMTRQIEPEMTASGYPVF